LLLSSLGGGDVLPMTADEEHSRNVRVAVAGRRRGADRGAGSWGFRGFLGEAYEPTSLDEDRKKEPKPPPLRGLTQRSSIVNDAKRPGC
jgi:hypothetical protein